MCMCGDALCPSCNPGAAQAEARWSAVYEEVRSICGIHATAVDVLLDDGNDTGLGRLTDFVLKMMEASSFEPVSVVGGGGGGGGGDEAGSTYPFPDFDTDEYGC